MQVERKKSVGDDIKEDQKNVEASEKKKTREKWKIMKNVIVISLAFMLHFTAYSGAANLQSSINAEAGVGIASLAAVYCALLLSNLFLPAIIIRWVGCKWTIAGSFVAYMPYICVQLVPALSTLVPAGVAVGLGGGPLWVAKCTYLTVVAQIYGEITGASMEAMLSQFLGVFFLIFQLNQVWGNIISSTVLQSGDNSEAKTSLNETSIAALCGASFTSSVGEEVLHRQPQEKIEMMVGIFLACMVAACLTVAFGVDDITRQEREREGSSKGLSGLAVVATTFRLVAEPNQLLLITLTLWIGLEQAFFGADFTAAFVSCSLGTGYVGYVLATYGLANGVSSLLTSYIAKAVGRWRLVCVCSVVHLGVLVGLLCWPPRGGAFAMLFIFSTLTGICEGVWLVQVNALSGLLFPGKEEAAFSNFRLWESLGYVIAYVYSPYLRTDVKLIVLITVLCAGMFCYLIIENKLVRLKNNDDIVKNARNQLEMGCDNPTFNKVE